MEPRYTYRPFAALSTADAPRITPSRQSLDNRFPQLAFTIQIGSYSHFEVLLTTDRALFAAQRAADRNPTNFFPARAEDRRLQPAVGGSAVFIVPQPVLHSFAAATPRPQAIYFAAVAYTDANGSNPVYSQAPETLISGAPSVGLSADFRAETLATVLGIPVSRLVRHAAGTPLAQPFSFAAGRTTTENSTSGLTAADDRAGGEDGCASAAFGDPQPRSAGGANDYDDGYGSSDGYDDSASYLAGQAAHTEQGDSVGSPSRTYATPLASRFPQGYPEPAALQDAEEPWPSLNTGGDAGTFSYDDGFGADPGAAPSHSAGGLGSDGRAQIDTSNDEYNDGYEDGYEDENSDGENGADAVGRSKSGNGRRYGDEADDYAYEEAFAAAEAEDIFDPELPYAPLSAAQEGGVPTAPARTAVQPLTIEAQRAIIERIARFESGRDGYSAMNRDGEFRGLFGHDHAAYNRYHIGLSFGVVQFTQDSGNLGRLLTMMRDRDRTRFSAIFGADADALIRVTTAPGPEAVQSPNGRSTRVQPIGGADLWEEPWVTRFTQAGQHVPFQAAQNELAAQIFITPMLPFARWLELTTDRALTIVVDRAVHMGVGGARTWIIRAVGPIQTQAQRQQALAALRHPDLRSFQGATQGLRVDGELGPQTHAALIAALRTLGTASPIEIPTRDQMLAAMVRHSSSERWGHRVQALRNATDCSDTVFEF